MRFLADMGVSATIVTWLRDQGHDVVHLRDQGLQCLRSGRIFAKAVAEGRIILTFDLDFGEILALSGGEVVNVILFRFNNTKTEFAMQRIEAVLVDSAEVLDAGAIVGVDDGRHRVRRLPLGQ